MWEFPDKIRLKTVGSVTFRYQGHLSVHSLRFQLHVIVINGGQQVTLNFDVFSFY